MSRSSISATGFPQNVFEAAFLLSTVYRCFPRHTVHLVVVDPGVGTDRKIVALKTLEGTFIGPDNGVLSYVLRNYAKDVGLPSANVLHQVELMGDARAVAVTNSRHFRQPVSATFHGRDIMAPVAVMLSQGMQFSAFGEPLQRLNMLDLPQPAKHPDGTLIGHVILIDSFGNLITDVRADDLPQGELRIELGKHVINGLKNTYAEGTGLMALIGSSGYLELAVPGGSAAGVTRLTMNDTVKIRAGA